MTHVTIEFRVWVHPDDPAEIEVWYSGLESTEPGTCFVSDWAKESLCNEDFHELFELDPDCHWQVVGKARLCGSYDYFGEYDEELKVLQYTKAKVYYEDTQS